MVIVIERLIFESGRKESQVGFELNTFRNFSRTLLPLGLRFSWWNKMFSLTLNQADLLRRDFTLEKGTMKLLWAAIRSWGNIQPWWSLKKTFFHHFSGVSICFESLHQHSMKKTEAVLRFRWNFMSFINLYFSLGFLFAMSLVLDFRLDILWFIFLCNN